MRCLSTIGAGLRPERNIMMPEWADTYRRLPAAATKEYGKYRTDRTPYNREIMEQLSPQSPTTKVVFMKPTQSGGSELGNNLLFYTAHLFPAPCAFVMPTQAMAEKHSKKKIATSLKCVPCLKDKIRDATSKNSGNTILLKEFPGGSWLFTGSSSPTQARSDSIKILVLDDYDGFEQAAGDEGAPGELFIRRTDTYGDSKKIFINSTPTVKNTSAIEREYNNSSMAQFFMSCPKCKKDMLFSWEYLKFDSRELTRSGIYMECPHCQFKIKEHQKTKMMHKGHWIHRQPEHETKGYLISGLYSPVGWVSWYQIIKEFLDAKGNIETLKVWTNTRMAETFEQMGDQPEWSKIKARCEPYLPMTIPNNVIVLTAGVDTHDNRLDVVVRGWGKNEESWLVYWGQLYGDPARPEVWAELDQLINYNYEKKNGTIFKLRWVSIDAMGHRTMDVYRYCRKWYPIVIPIHGSKTPGKQILSAPTKKDVDFVGNKIKNGVELWPVGTEMAKMTIYQRLQLDKIDRGYYHNYVGLNDEYFQQLTAEKLITKYINGYPLQKWENVRPGGANHALDAEVYCYHAALRAGIDRLSPQGLPATVEKRGIRIVSKGIKI